MVLRGMCYTLAVVSLKILAQRSLGGNEKNLSHVNKCWCWQSNPRRPEYEAGIVITT
jgi:hypothetical protein